MTPGYTGEPILSPEWTYEDDVRETRMKIMQSIVDEQKKIERHREGIIRSNQKIEKLRKRLEINDSILVKSKVLDDAEME